jgi:hypothetical protein
MKLLHLLALFLILILVLNFFFFVLGKISTTSFWATLIIIGIISFILRYAKSIKKEGIRK